MRRTPGLHFVVPGALEQRTGGYLYDARMVEGLRAQGRDVLVHNLEGRFPGPDPAASRSLADTLASLPAGSVVVVDGLALGAHPEAVAPHAESLRIVALVHHPLADETGLDPEERRLLRGLEGEALSQVRGVVVTSPFTRERLGAYGVGGDRVRAVLPGTEGPAGGRADPHGVHARPDSGQAARAAADPDSGPLLLVVGSVVPRKGHDVLVEALAEVAAVPWRCVCAGSLDRDPDFARRVVRLVADSGLDGRIRFTGELEESRLAAYYRTADLFVLPSHYEGYGMALTEALLHGLPVVSTTGGAIPHTVPEDTGILVPPGDAEALAGAMRALLADPDRRASCAARARVHGAGLPDWRTQVRAFEAAVEELAGMGAVPRD